MARDCKRSTAARRSRQGTITVPRELQQFDELRPQMVRTADDAPLFAEEVAIRIERDRQLGQGDDDERAARIERLQCARGDLRTSGEIDRHVDVRQVVDSCAEGLGRFQFFRYDVDDRDRARAECAAQMQRGDAESTEAEDCDVLAFAQTGHTQRVKRGRGRAHHDRGDVERHPVRNPDRDRRRLCRGRHRRVA